MKDRSDYRGLIGRRRVLSGAAAAGAGLALAGCGAKSRQSASQSASNKPAGQPKPGGKLAMPVTADPFNWDKTSVGPGIPNAYGIPWAYDSLLTFKSGPGVQYADLIPAPNLAEKWESPDPTTYTFHLGNGLQFANLPPVNGRALTSADVQWSFEYSSRTGAFKSPPAAQYSYFFEGMDRLDTPDPQTVVVHFKDAFAPFLQYVSSSSNPIFPHEIYDKDGSFQKQIVGSGVFQLDTASSQPGSHWTWKKNANYWQSGKPYIDEIDWLVLPDDASAYAAFRTKQVDLVFANISTEAASQLAKDNPDVTKFEYEDPSPLHLYMNERKPPLNDVRIRKAIALSIDRDAYLKALYGGKGGWALAGAFPDTFTQAEIKQLLKYDPAQAKQLVSDAGFPNGVSLDFSYPGNAYGQEYITEMQLFQAQLKPAGINLNLVSLDKATESARKKTGDYVITFTSKSLEGDIDSYLYAVFYPGSRANYGGVDDPALTPLLVAQRRELDAAKRKQIARQAVQYINVDQVHALALVYRVSYQFWHPRLQNYVPNWATGNSSPGPLRNAWLSA